MLEPGEDFGLVVEALHLGRGDAGINHFERDGAARVGLLGLVDDAHATDAEQSSDAVLADGLEGGWMPLSPGAKSEREAVAEGGSVEQAGTDRRLVLFEQFEDFAQEFQVAVALLPRNRSAPSGSMQVRAENAIDLGEAAAHSLGVSRFAVQPGAGHAPSLRRRSIACRVHRMRLRG